MYFGRMRLVLDKFLMVLEDRQECCARFYIPAES